MMERKLFLQIKSINITYPNEENIIVLPITKRIEIVMSIQVCPISRMNFDCEESGGKKALLANPKHQIVYPSAENKTVMPVTKRMEIITSIQVCLISRMNFDCKENGGKRSFSCKSKSSISCIPL